MLVTNIALIVVMLMIIKQDAGCCGDEDCYGQCHFSLCWLSRVTGGQELGSSSEDRALASQAAETKRGTERRLEVSSEDNKSTIKT